MFREDLEAKAARLDFFAQKMRAAGALSWAPPDMPEFYRDPSEKWAEQYGFGPSPSLEETADMLRAAAMLRPSGAEYQRTSQQTYYDRSTGSYRFK